MKAPRKKDYIRKMSMKDKLKESEIKKSGRIITLKYLEKLKEILNSSEDNDVITISFLKHILKIFLSSIDNEE